MTKNLFKAIDKYLKLRTIRILREKHLNDYTCLAVTHDIRFAKTRWYKHQLRIYAIRNNHDTYVPMVTLAIKNKTTEAEERLKFLNYLEDLVLKGKA